MRSLALLALFAAAFGAQAQTLEVSVIQGIHEPVRYAFALTGQREQIDLREHHNYQVAIHDPASKKDICREGVYQTGLLLTLRPIEPKADGDLSVEIVGQVSTLDDLKEDGRLPCGPNFKPQLTNAPFSDTVQVKAKKKRLVIIDGKYTVILSVR